MSQRRIGACFPTHRVHYTHAHTLSLLLNFALVRSRGRGAAEQMDSSWCACLANSAREGVCRIRFGARKTALRLLPKGAAAAHHRASAAAGVRARVELLYSILHTVCMGKCQRCFTVLAARFETCACLFLLLGLLHIPHSSNAQIVCTALENRSRFDCDVLLLLLLSLIDLAAKNRDQCVPCIYVAPMFLTWPEALIGSSTPSSACKPALLHHLYTLPA